jgi:glycosyltransferase involved in cell wall biosynthesis
MKINKFVTITVNLYNYGRFIEDCIQSILNQTYENFELIVVDDCSTDDSYDRAKKFENKDNRVKVIRLNKNSGVGCAKNEGIIRSKGDYIVTLDADDVMTKKSLEIRLKAAIKNKVSFVYADAIWFREMNLKDIYKLKLNTIKTTGKSPKKGPTLIHGPTVCNIHAATVLVSKGIYKKYGLYDEDLKCRVDREMWLRLFGKKEIDKPRISSYFINSPVAFYRWHSKQIYKKRRKDTNFNKINVDLCEKKYKIRRKDINRNNTRFWDN